MKYGVKDGAYVTELFNNWLITLAGRETDGNVGDLGFWWNDISLKIGPFKTAASIPPVLNLAPTGLAVPGRWNRLVNEYAPDFPEFVRGPIVKKLLYYAEGSYMFNQGYDHSRGNCLLSATFGFRKGGTKLLQLTGVSRSGFLVPMGPFDLSLLILMAQELAKRKGSKYYRVKWWLSQGQLNVWQSAPWFKHHGLFDRLPEGDIKEAFKSLITVKFKDPAVEESKWQAQRRWRAVYYDIGNREAFYPIAPLVKNPREIRRSNLKAKVTGGARNVPESKESILDNYKETDNGNTD